MKTSLAKIGPSLLIVAQTIIAYLIIIIPAEYLLTEKYFVIPTIDPIAKTYLFLILFLIFFLVNFFLPKFKKISIKYWPIFLAALVISLIVSQAYAAFYNRLQENPKIFSLSSDWSIVGMEIEINGKNFGPAWQAGQVSVGDFIFRVEDWSENKIIVAQPNTTNYFTDQICVTKYNGKVSNCLPFKIRDPGELQQNSPSQ
jgi:hypothetical protein